MYQVLYRKWRSQTFAEIYGQPGIVAALRGEMRTGKIAHAYLFTGSRGTGKTSCAKILAKAVNCLDLRDGDPCNACDSCRGIDNGSILDVVEIDAASNNGVDNIRDLREEVNYTPVSVKYRVYIIDEVHMLSIGAFNALLKTLEEPPEHVIFVLATTEAHKLPATILSRCQRFDFNRIPPADIAARIHYIAGQENFTVENEAAALIARLADGGMRDALSLLDQCLSRAEEAEGIKQVTAAVVVDTAGLAGDDCLYELSAAVLESNGAAALEIVDKLYASSRDMERLCADLVYFYRNLMVVKSVADPGGLVVASSDEIGRLRAEAEKYPLPAILHCMDVLQRGADRLRSGASRRVEMELVMLRLCSPQLDSGNEALLRRVKVLEDASQGIGSGQLSADCVQSVLISDQPPEPAKKAIIPEPTAAPEPEEPFERWGEVLHNLSETCVPLFAALKNSNAGIRGDMVLIQADSELFRSLVGQDDNKALLASAIRAVTGKNCRIGIKKVTAGQKPADPLSALLQNAREKGVNIVES